MVELFANSGDPDKTPHYAVSDTVLFANYIATDKMLFSSEKMSIFLISQ